MKKFLFVLLFVLGLLLCGCTGSGQIPSSLSEPDSLPTEDSFPTDETVPEEDPVPVEDSVSSDGLVPPEPLPVIEDENTFHSEFMGLSISVPEGWSVLDRQEIAATLGYNEAYANADPKDILAYHYPYVELFAIALNGSSLQFMIENPPITMLDESEVRTPAEYMDHNESFMPEYYSSMGLKVANVERGTIRLAGRDYESFSFTSYRGDESISQTMMATEKDGYFFTIYITCVGEDRTEEFLALFTPDE